MEGKEEEAEALRLFLGDSLLESPSGRPPAPLTEAISIPLEVSYTASGSNHRFSELKDEEDEAPPPRDNLEGDPLAADLREELLR
tara:strand:- start:127 stop:381 length:255 start_codon:yes stop_codon:yes gene_type:complete